MKRRQESFASRLPRVALVMASFAVLVGMIATARAQSPVVVLPPERGQYTPLDAGADAYRAEEGRRMAEIDSQLGLNNRMRYQSWYGSLYRGVFEAWPMVPGDIWGYPMLNPVRQSVGQRSYQAGPTRWISEPVYAADIAVATPVGAGVAAGPVIRPTLGVPILQRAMEGAPRALPNRRVELPAPRPEPSDLPVPTGPREF